MEGVKRASRMRVFCVSAAIILLVILIVIYPGLHQSGVDTELRDAVLHQDEARVRSALQDGANARELSWVVDRSPIGRLMRGQNPFGGRRRALPPANARAGAQGNQQSHTLLMYAADTGNAAIVRDLLDHGADVDARLANGNTALFMSVARRSEACTDALLQRGADVNYRNSSGLTPLHVAAKNDSAVTLGQLLLHHADVKAKDNNGLTPLTTAAKAHSANACLLLMDWGADPSDLRSQSSAEHASAKTLTGSHYPDENESLLAWAASKGSLELVRRAWERLLTPDERDRQAPEALYEAVTARSRAVASFLLAQGVSPNTQVRVAHLSEIARTPSTASPMFQTSRPFAIGPSAIGRAADPVALPDHGPRMNGKLVSLLSRVTGYPARSGPNRPYLILSSPLASACENDDRKMVDLLLTHHADVNWYPGSGDTPLMAAAEWPPILDLLISKGADIHARSFSGQTALMAACDRLCPTVDRLIAAGSDVNARDDTGATPLIHAIRNHSPQTSARLVRTLLQHGAKPDIRDNQGKTAIAYARLSQTTTTTQPAAPQETDSENIEGILSKALARAQP